jgi:hypothetical protein
VHVCNRPIHVGPGWRYRDRCGHESNGSPDSRIDGAYHLYRRRTLGAVTTDTAGRYITNMNTGSDPFDGGSGNEFCRFSEPAGQNARVQLDTTLGFVRGPVLVALQFVDLHEP